MNPKIRVTSGAWRVTGTGPQAVYHATRHPSPVTRAGFTLVEVLMAMVLLSLIVLSLMAVFNSTQNAFRASLTQTDVLESGRLTMGLMTSDLEAMTPSLKPINTNIVYWYLPGNDPNNTNNNVNLYAAVTTFASPPSPLFQGLTASSQQRTNVLENFFSLSRQTISGSPSWVGTGYAVGTNSPDGALYPLYRFYMTTNTITGTPASLFNTFASLQYTNTTNWSHLMDGVVGLTVRAYDPNGFLMTNTCDFYNGQFITNQNTGFFLPPAWGEVGFYMYSNTIPAAVEVEMGVLEDAILQRAEGFNGNSPAQQNYLSNHVGQVHVFRQRIVIRNVDPTAYQ
jgi:prepilin-type N-terminal cleavage/methylation domain-containing protein